VALALTVALSAALGSSAQASTVTVGSPLTAAFAPAEYGAGSPITSFNSALPEPGANVTSPVTGVILRWSIVGAEGGPFKLRVLAPGTANKYTGAGTSGGGIPSSTAVQTFATVLPIKAGQTIGLDNTNDTDKIGQAPVVGASFGYLKPAIVEGATAAGNEVTGKEVGFNAEIQPLPTITKLTPADGTFEGGATVTISGTDFVDVKSVSFGEQPAAGYTVDSAGQITAVAPEVSGPQTVDVTVTTIAGKSLTVKAGEFAYAACTVPNLKGKKLKGARKALTRNGCKLGAVRRKPKTGKHPKVIKQDVATGKTRAPGTKVGVKLG
jgi:IPT/TIG domain-containing protein/PASTA domain-containing protein